ncbi:MAG TPA: hypothetical protein VLT36_11100 [Candidatus Dormibacteraeota bacterium]|nr:hypothetical protein [Candidatus Dormibacteraeota bacterium]
MRKAGFALFLLGVSVCATLAQVSVDLQLEQDQFLPGEKLQVAVRITNRSGRTLHLGSDADWLTFSVEGKDGTVVHQLEDVPVKGEFDVENSQRATKRVDISQCFALTQAGRYTVLAKIKIKDWDQQVASLEKEFNIIEGSRLWAQDVGIPSTNNAPPEVRKYILQQANYINNKLRLYLRITDEAGVKVIKAVPIGTVLSFSRPETQVDKLSNLHLLYQDWAHSFSYFVFNPDGELLTHAGYDFSGDRPRLRLDEDGNVEVSGGTRRAAANNHPAPTLSSDDPKPSNP